MNIYSFTGRLGRDAEQRFSQGGLAICSFTVAVDYGYGDKKGTNWVRCSLFGKRAEGGLPQYLKKGAQVAVTGELQIREYDDKDGNKRTSVDVNVGNIDLIGGRDGVARQGGGSGYSGGGQASTPSKNDPFADQPDFNSAPVDDDIPF